MSDRDSEFNKKKKKTYYLRADIIIHRLDVYLKIK